ncbi:SubName: Full=Uncharacterized protein {ECO:0000313/EMBL:CCA75686.1} [Serendipita indica DSM 11827]|nr:SubName: Full=Uncharacterized protein {ECO:0000313/EMBL:CCA75686.1} [Serendipita indica DSM 11827]
MLNGLLQSIDNAYRTITQHRAFRFAGTLIRVGNTISAMKIEAESFAQSLLTDAREKEFPAGVDSLSSAHRQPAKKKKNVLGGAIGSPIRKIASIIDKTVWSRSFFLTVAILVIACLLELYVTDTGNSHPKQTDSPVAAIAKIQDQFEGVLRHSGSGLMMKWDITKAELAVEDLKSVVEESDLKCRDRLTPVLSEYVLTSAKVAKQLPRLDTALVGAVTHMLATNKYAVQSLGEIKQSSGLSSALSFLWGARMTEERFVEIFSTICLDMIEDLTDLLRIGMRLSDDLDRQQSLLRTTRQIIGSDERANHILNEETLRQWWTKIGGNKDKLHSFKTNKELLDRAHEYSDVALKHVVWTLGQLEEIEATVKDLMAKIKRWPLKKGVPVQLHIDILMGSMLKLAQVRDQAQHNKDVVADNVANGHKYQGLPGPTT